MQDGQVKEWVMRFSCRVTFGIAVAAWYAQTSGGQIVAEPIGLTFNSPIFLTAPEGDDRLFVVEQDGLIRIVQNGAILPTPFLDLTTLTTQSGERGLLGMAFHPDYDSNGLFYVHYTSIVDGSTVLEQYEVSGDPNVADALSGDPLLNQAQPAPNHNGGMIAFKPGEAGNFLYMALGDGGGSGDPDENGQDLDTILGKILRLDVDNAGAPPTSNPFVGVAGDDRIWIYGVRNPWRFSFDRLTGDMYIGEVGQNNFEEIDFIDASSTGGENLGWDLLEGTNDFECVDCDQARLDTVLPIHEYPHGDGISVTGGYVYRGDLIPSLQGTYFFADISGRVWSFRYDGATLTEFQEHGTEFIEEGLVIVSFGEDGFGELYVVSHGGSIFKIMDVTPTSLVSSSGGGLIEEGDTAVLSVEVAGTTGMVSYEWFKQSTPLADGGTISGAATPELTISPVALSDSGNYFLHVTDEAKALFVTPPITLTVVPVGSLPAMGMLGMGILVGIVGVAGILYVRRRMGGKNQG